MASLSQQGIHCTRSKVAIDTSAFNTPLGTTGPSALVSATVTCTIDVSGLGLPGINTRTITKTMTSPLDSYRGRSWTSGRHARLRFRLRGRRCRDERGSISVWMIASAVALIGIAGIGTDLSGQVHTKQHAQDVAAQAARVGAEQVSDDVVTGHTATIDFAAARYAAQQYLQAAGLDGSVSVLNGTTIEVTTAETYDTTFLGLLGISHLKVTGHASAQLIRTQGGVAQ